MDDPGAREHAEGMDVAELHRRSVETWTDRVRAVAADQWDGPTPCTEWNVRELVNRWSGPRASRAAVVVSIFRVEAGVIRRAP